MVRGHRNDIDGLRSVAILPVLFYHAGLRLFAGGYVGVDVFFVISGYLITGLILRAQDGAGFSLAEFYDRRVRRILPALFAMLAAASLAALVLLAPSELIQFGQSLLAAVLFYANILYVARDANYFAPVAADNPLLHVWSLAVEEQFYLLWPLVLMAVAHRRRALIAVVALIGLVSLAAALIVPAVNESFAFYLLPTRAWQLLLGAAIAIGIAPAPAERAARDAVTLVGIALIGLAVVRSGAFIGTWGILVAPLGAALYLYAAEGGGSLAGSILSTRLPVFIGRISYSLYLWHWPLLVFARFTLGRPLHRVETLAVLALSIAVSALSWRFIEQPARQGRFGGFKGVRISFAAALAGAALLSTAAAVFIAADGLPMRVPPDVRAVDAVIGTDLHGGWCDPARKYPDHCLTGDRAAPREAVLWGDSHARALVPGLALWAQDSHLRLKIYTEGACAPLSPIVWSRPETHIPPRCEPFGRQSLQAILADRDAHLVILEARWYALIAKNRLHGPHARELLRAALDDLLHRLTAEGRRVVLIGNVTEFQEAPGTCYVHARMLGRDAAPCRARPRAAALGDIAASEALLDAVAARYPSVTVYHPSEALCDGDACRAFDGSDLLYYDTDHLTPAGARIVARGLEHALPGLAAR